MIEFPTPRITPPLPPFADGFVDNVDVKVDDNCILSVNADNSFTILAQSELLVIGKSSPMLKGINTETSKIYGLHTHKSDLPHRYSLFGASELGRFLVMQLFWLEW